MAHPPPEGTELVETIGAGSVFDVALVREGDSVLVSKRLASRVRSEPAARAAIVREAKLLAHARHPALPSLVRVGSDGHGPYLLETRADGASVREIVEAWEVRTGTVPATLVAHVARESILALAELHELSDEGGSLAIVHGDLGPDHVLMGALGQIRFIDFGAARCRGLDPSVTSADRGTLPFVAPEIARGDAPPSAEGDVYALTATLLYLAVGHPLTRSRDEAAMLLEIGERGLDPTLLDEATALSSRQRTALATALSVHPASRPTARALFTAAFALE